MLEVSGLMRSKQTQQIRVDLAATSWLRNATQMLIEMENR